MQKKTFLGFFTCMLVVLTVFTACTQPAPTLTPTPTPTSSPGPTPTPTQANWWDKFGEPQYGGTMTIAEAQVGLNWDVLMFGGGGAFYEPLFYPDWTLDRTIWPFTGVFTPDQYWKGNLAESWEIPDQQTLIAHVRKGVKWQDKPPVNGREFTAYDVEAHYYRVMTESPMFAGMLIDWEKVTAIDKNTVVFKFKKQSGHWLQSVTDVAAVIEAPEWAALDEAARNKWENTVGTGPWILTDFLEGSSYTYSKNPDYWGHDERYPENQIPYVDKYVSLIILDASTRMAALRTGKIDILGISMTFLDWQQAATLTKSNPEILQKKIPQGSFGVTFKVDAEPFTDIRVRKALNMALDRETIAKTRYGGFGRGKPCGLISTDYKEYSFAYEEWPQEIKDEYAYNPEGARQLLADAGYPNGFKTNVVVSNTLDIETMEIIQAQFADIDVDMKINVTDWPGYENVRRAGKHDQMIAENGAFTWPLVRAIEQFYSKGPDIGETNVNDPVYDSLRDQFFAATDPAEAQRLAKEIDRRVIEQHWLVTAGEYYTYNVWQPYLKGYSGELLFQNVNLTLARFWIDHGLK